MSEHHEEKRKWVRYKKSTEEVVVVTMKKEMRRELASSRVREIIGYGVPALFKMLNRREDEKGRSLESCC